MPRGTRPRVACPECGRSIAVTFDHSDGIGIWRSHTQRPGVLCPKSGRKVGRAAPAWFVPQAALHGWSPGDVPALQAEASYA